eukprot:gene6158-10165_t
MAYEAWDEFPSELFSYSIFIAPVTSFFGKKDSVDLCKGFERISIKNTSTPCEDYFCSTQQPFHLAQWHNKNLTLEQRQKGFVAHNAMHRYCTKCSITYENFTRTNCIYFNNKTCHSGRCEPGTVCIEFNKHEVMHKRPFDTLDSVCYDFGDNRFYNHADFTHKYYFWYYYRYGTLIALVFQIIAFFVSTVTILIPEIGHLLNRIFLKRPRQTIYDSIQDIFTLRNISFGIMYLTLLIDMLLIFIDQWGLMILRLSTVFVAVLAFGSFFSFALLAILWQHILTLKGSGRSRFAWYIWAQLILLILFNIVMITGSVGSYLGAYNIDKQRRGFFIYALGFFELITSFVYLGVIIVLSFLSALMFYKIHKYASYEEKAANVFKERYTIFVMLCLPMVSVLCVSVIVIAAQNIIGKDMISLQLYLFIASFYSFYFVVIFVVLCFGIFHFPSFKKCYRCKNLKSISGDE